MLIAVGPHTKCTIGMHIHKGITALSLQIYIYPHIVYIIKEAFILQLFSMLLDMCL